MNRDVPSIPGYEILELLGQGGMGTVYLSRDLRLERRVALKLLPHWLAANPSARQRFLNEARAAAALEHPNICTVYEVDETPDGVVYIAMSYCQGRTLEARLAEGPLPVGEAISYAADIARALAKAHEKRIVHRDIKPANIMLPAEGGLKILDFGVAKLPDADLTWTGGVIGTAAYMSPEQSRADPVDHRTDVWALGVVLYEMLCGRRPFGGATQAALIYNIMASEPLPISAVRRDLPASLDSMIRRLLSKEPNDRPGSAHELAQELSALGAMFPAGASRTEAGPSTRTLEGERRPVALLAARLDGYDRLVERLDPDDAEVVVSLIRNAVLDLAERHHAYIAHFQDDDLLCLFGVQASREDDALRAVKAAHELIARVEEIGAGLESRLGMPLQARAGVHVGPVVVQGGRARERPWKVTGAPITQATRLASEADPGSVRVSRECERLTRPFARSTWTPYVGRAGELNTLGALVEAARGGQGQAVSILGEAGLGKTRLVGELRARCGGEGVRVLVGRCNPEGRGTPYVPFIEVLGEALQLAGHETAVARATEVVARVRSLAPALVEYLPLYLHLLAVTSAEYPLPRHLQGEHLQAAMNEALAALITARQGVATLLCVEDVQWADAGSRMVLRQLAEIAPSYPLLLATTGRADAAIDWGSATPLVIQLGPLDPQSTESVIRAMLQAERSDAALTAWLHERTGGNPFFLEEAVQALLEEQAVAVIDGTAVLRHPDRPLQLPETVQAVIRARIDRLDPDTRETLRVASVVGRDFGRAVLERVLGRPAGLPAHLDRLKVAGLVQQIRVAPEATYRFKHSLIHEAAYASLLAHQRRALHGATGHAIEQLFGERLDEHLESLARHFGHAEEWHDAVRYGMQAARRAANLNQFVEALDLLELVQGWLEQVPEAERQNDLTDVLLMRERMYESLGLRDRQQRLIEEVIALQSASGPSTRLAEAHLRQGDLLTLLGRFDGAARALTESLRMSRELGDRDGERNALRSLGMMRWHEGRNDEALRIVQEAVDLDRNRDDVEALVGDLHNLGTILKSMKQYEEALASLSEALDRCIELADPIGEMYATHAVANIYRELGDTERAREYHQRADRVAIAARKPVLRSFSLMALASIALDEGATHEALRLYQELIEIGRKARHAEGLAQALRARGDVLLGMGQASEAVTHMTEAAGLFAQLQDTASELAAIEGMLSALPRDHATPEIEQWTVRALELAEALGDGRKQVSLRNTLGILAWERGDFSRALEHYERARELVRRTSQRADEGLVLNSLGVTLNRLGRHEDARRVLLESVALNETTGQRLLQAHALAALGETCAAAGHPGPARQYYEEAIAIRTDLGHADAAERLAGRVRELSRSTVEEVS